MPPLKQTSHFAFRRGNPLKSTSVPLAFRIARTPLLKNILTFITPRFVVASSVKNVYADKSKVTEALIDRYFDLSLRSGNRQALVDRMQMPFDSSRVGQIKTIDQPTLILWGAQDGLIPLESAYRFQKDLPNDTLVVLESSTWPGTTMEVALSARLIDLEGMRLEIDDRAHEERSLS